MAKILVLGGNGLLGKAIVKALAIEHEVQVLSRATDFYIERYETFPQIKPPLAAVVNCAGFVSSDQENISKIMQVNAVGPYNAARFAAENHSRLFHISSISAIHSRANQYYNEYGISKSAGDDLLTHFCTKNSSPYALLRFSQLYDYPGKAANSQGMLYRLIQQLQNEGTATLFGTKNPIRNYLHVDDAAFMVKFCIEKKIQGLWNCIHPENITIYELIKKMATCLNLESRINLLLNKGDLLSIDVPTKQLLHKIIPDFKPVLISDGIKEIIRHGSV